MAVLYTRGSLCEGDLVIDWRGRLGDTIEAPPPSVGTEQGQRFCILEPQLRAAALQWISMGEAQPAVDQRTRQRWAAWLVCSQALNHSSHLARTGMVSPRMPIASRCWEPLCMCSPRAGRASEWSERAVHGPGWHRRPDERTALCLVEWWISSNARPWSWCANFDWPCFAYGRLWQ